MNLTLKKPLMLLALVSGACLWSTTLAQADPDLAAGEKVFKSSCAQCHPGGGNIIKPAESLKGDHFTKEFSSDAKIENLVRSGRKGTPMPAFDKQRITDKQMVDLIAYIRSLTPKKSK